MIDEADEAADGNEGVTPGDDLAVVVTRDPEDDGVFDAFQDIMDSVSLPGSTTAMGADGLPVQTGGSSDTGEIPLSPDTLTCMADPANGRAVCKHYVRQMLALGDNSTNQHIYRLCGARKSQAGAFMDVSGGVWGCDLRVPQDALGIRRLDDFDAKKLREGKQRVSLRLFKA